MQQRVDAASVQLVLGGSAPAAARGLSWKGALKVLGVVALCIAAATVGYKSEAGLSRAASAFASAPAAGSTDSAASVSTDLASTDLASTSASADSAASADSYDWVTTDSASASAATESSKDYTPIQPQNYYWVYCQPDWNPQRGCNQPGKQDQNHPAFYVPDSAETLPDEYTQNGWQWDADTPTIPPLGSVYINLHCTDGEAVNNSGNKVKHNSDINCEFSKMEDNMGFQYATWYCYNKSSKSHHHVYVEYIQCFKGDCVDCLDDDSLRPFVPAPTPYY